MRYAYVLLGPSRAKVGDRVARLADRARAGRPVLYRRTPLGDALAAQADP